MKIIITGSLGHISKPVVNELVKAGNNVVVISSSKEKETEVKALGAVPAIGSLTDTEFVSNTFKGAGAAYLMTPPNFVTDDFLAYQKLVADNYISAIKQNGVKYIVHLSSIGGHLDEDNGPIRGVAYLERALSKLENVNVVTVRPGYFYYNFLALAGLLKHAGIIGSNFGNTEESVALVHTQDIADVISGHLKTPAFEGHVIEYIASDIRHPNEIASVLGGSVGKPETPWVTFKDEESLQGMLQAGVKENLASLFVEMGRGFREGKIQAHFKSLNAKATGKIKLEDFAKEFAAVYNTN